MNRTTDIDKINAILKHDDIWPNISDPSDDINAFCAPVSDDIHYLYEPGALFILHPEGDDLQIHANVTKAKRGESMRIADEALFYGFKVLNSQRIVAKIPTKYTNVVRFAKLFMNLDEIIDDICHFTLEKEQWDS